MSSQIAEYSALVHAAHDKAAIDNPNASSLAVATAAKCGAPFHVAVIGALATLGSFHGPIMRVRTLLFGSQANEVDAAVARGEIIPGFGNEFFRDRLDPALDAVDSYARQNFWTHYKRVKEVAEKIEKRRGSQIFPNAACFTAILAEKIGMEYGTELSIVIQFRMGAWRRIYTHNSTGRVLAGGDE